MMTPSISRGLVGWRQVRLKDCFSYGKGLNITKADLVEDGTPVISYGQIHAKQNDGTHLKGELLRYVPEELAESTPGARLKTGDIVFADTSEDLDGVGNCVVNDVGDGVYAGYHTLVARAKDPRNSKYLSYLFQTDCWREQLRKRACGIKVFSLTQRLLSNVKVVLPPHPEQERITAFLDEKCAAVDKVIEVKRKQLESIAGQRKSLITQSVVFGLGACRSRKTGIEWMPLVNSDWEVVSLKRLLSRKMEYGLSEAAELEDESLPRYIRITDFGDDGELKGDTFRSLPVEIAKEAMLQANDVLFARSGATVGKSYIYTGWRTGACFAGYLIRAQTKTWRLNPKFLYYFTKSAAYDAWKGLIFTQATIQNISAVKYGQLKMPVPPVGTQNAIVSYLELKERKFDALAANLRKQIETLEQYRKSLIHEYVTGVRRVA